MLTELLKAMLVNVVSRLVYAIREVPDDEQDTALYRMAVANFNAITAFLMDMFGLTLDEVFALYILAHMTQDVADQIRADLIATQDIPDAFKEAIKNLDLDDLEED